MDNLRRFIEAQPVAFKKALACLGKQPVFALEGDSYKRPLNPALPDDLQRWHRRKNVYLVCNREIGGQLFSAELCVELGKGFQQLRPLYELFWRVM